MEGFPFGTAFDPNEAGPVYNTVPSPSNVAPSFVDGPVVVLTLNVGVYGSGSSSAVGTPNPFVLTHDAPPPGLNIVLEGATATVSGTPEPGTEGIHILNLTAINGVVPDANQNFEIHIS